MVTYSSPSSSEPTLIAKSSILLDVKPWDDETDMATLEECVRSIQMDGLVWGQCKNNTVIAYSVRHIILLHTVMLYSVQLCSKEMISLVFVF